MKRVRTVLLPTLLAIVVGLTGCTILDRGIVKVEPSTVHMGETLTLSYIFKCNELSTVTVSSIDWKAYRDGNLYGQGTVSPGSSGWKTGTVPPFQEVVIYSITGTPAGTGSWEHRVVFHTSEGDFPARGGWTVLP